MGGCRCSYRNCTVRSDGKTHFFHYPVFDKPRGQQWIVNARAYDLLNLSVRQVRNKVVCQHHFTDDMFMNDEKNNLKFHAIPTENGPYCTDNQPPLSGDFGNLHIITPIKETPKMKALSKKQANFPHRYVDYLNNEEPELDITVNKNNSQVKLEGNIVGNTSFIEPEVNNIQLKQNVNDSALIQDIKANFQLTDNVEQIKMVTDASKIDSDLIQDTKENFIIYDNAEQHKKKFINTSKKKNNKIKILSETVISQPLSFNVNGNVMDVSTPIVVNNPSQFNKDNILVQNVGGEEENIIEISIPGLAQTKLEQSETKHASLDNFNLSNNKLKVSAASSTPVQKSPTKPIIKLTPERKAAIAEKRRFNMKLRDLIEAGLNNKSDLVTKEEIDAQVKDIRVSQQESKNMDPKLTFSKNDNSYRELQNMFDHKLQNMQNTLLKKIDDNAKEIALLKRNLQVKQPARASLLKTNRTLSTQTVWPDNDYKSYLFNSISDFISPELKNSLYEELFIHKFKTEGVGKKRKSKRIKPNTPIYEP